MPNVSESLAPGLLIAPPSLLDPNFLHSVVLLAVHNDGGALGFVVNRPAPLSVGDLLAMAGYDEKLKRHASPVLVGGPVQPSSIWILAVDPSLDAGRQDVLGVGERLRITSSRAALDAFVHGLEERPADARDPLQRLL